MRRTLLIHPASAGAGGLAIEVDAERLTGRLHLGFVLTGALARLTLPPPTAPLRRDELWRTTCFEAFVGRTDEAGYCEYNVSPSTEWASYRFDGYRQGMRPLETRAPSVAVNRTDERLELQVDLHLPDDLADGALRLGLSAIIEASGGEKSYWALAHPPGKPDFHHADCFAARLAAPEGG